MRKSRTEAHRLIAVTLRHDRIDISGSRFSTNLRTQIPLGEATQVIFDDLEIAALRHRENRQMKWPVSL